jgi:DNA-directed RNA polymerase specialized sigma24 family protein
VTAVERHLANLSGDLHAVFRYRYVENLTQAEAAHALGVSRQTLRTLERRLQRGLAQAFEGPHQL